MTDENLAHTPGQDAARELTADLFITLDGYALGEGAPAYFGFFGPDLERWIDNQIATPQVLLMGRVTYQAMSAIVASQPVEGADRMNELPKVIFSKTLRGPLAWTSSRLAADLIGEVHSLKAQAGSSLRTIGSLSIVKTLMRAGLVDRFRLVMFPQILGDTGREPLFSELPDINLELIDTTVLDDRLVTLEYRPTLKTESPS